MVAIEDRVTDTTMQFKDANLDDYIRVENSLGEVSYKMIKNLKYSDRLRINQNSKSFLIDTLFILATDEVYIIKHDEFTGVENQVVEDYLNHNINYEIPDVHVGKYYSGIPIRSESSSARSYKRA